MWISLRQAPVLTSSCWTRPKADSSILRSAELHVSTGRKCTNLLRGIFSELTNGASVWNTRTPVTAASNRFPRLRSKVLRELRSSESRFTGEGHSDVSQHEVTWFAADQWTVSPRLLLDLGLRFDSDTVTSSVHAAPRVGFQLGSDPQRTNDAARWSRGVLRPRALDDPSLPVVPRADRLYSQPGGPGDQLNRLYQPDYRRSAQPAKHGVEFGAQPKGLQWACCSRWVTSNATP